MSDQNARQMTPEELVAHGYPADLHTRPGAYAEYQAAQQARDYNGHVPQEVRGYGQVPNPVEYPPVAAQRAEKPVKQARDRAQYVRQQKGHSWILHWIFLGVFTLWIVPIYYSFSPNHYWHI